MALLIQQRGRSVSADALAEGLWGDDQPENARKTIQVYISNLRKVLGDAAEHLQSGSGGYRLDTDVVDTDIDEFEALVSRSGQLANSSPSEAAHLLDEALGLWRGSPYADCDSMQLRSDVARLEEMRLTALEQRLEIELALGRHVAALAELGTMANDYPFRERVHGLHMLALYRSGRQAEALRAFSRLRTNLVDELGIEPSPELQRLEQRILDQDPDLDPTEDTVEMEETVLLFTDLVASTALWDADHSAMATALESHDQILDKAISLAGGHVWKRTGDGMLAVMPDVGSAVRASVQAQAEFMHDERLSVRMAIHTGPAHRRDNDYFGPALNLTARLLAAAHGGQTLLSHEATEELDPTVRTVDLGEHRFKGTGAPVRVHQLAGAEETGSFPSLTVESPALAIERIGFGRAIRGFELRERIGMGVTGEVYRAFQSSMSREVALKVIDAAVASEPDFVRRFESESRLISQLEHPHIVPVHDSWRDPEGAYLAMRFMRGGSLAKTLRSGTWKPAPALRLLEQVGSALSYAHRRGVLHLDIHPGNVLLDEDGNAYLADFVIAGGLGTPGRRALGHVAPELAQGHKPTSACDLYSFGVLVAAVLGIDPTSTDSPVADVIGRAIEADPARRYERPEDLLRAVRQALGADVVVDPVLAERPRDVRNPYKGLRAFQERDAADFFGREELTERLVDAIATDRLTAIVGPSGCGKSSVVKAGLIPRLREGAIPGSDQWHITEMFPGSYPFEELEEALLKVAVNRPVNMLESLREDEHGLVRVAKEILPDEDADLVLVIDQFEELFSLTADEDTRRAFMMSLATAVTDPGSRVRVVLTMRADFLDRPLAYTSFGELLERAVIPVAVPSEDGLTVAIAKPARMVGLDIEPGLVGQIVRDVADQPGALPLMQHALSELFERSDRQLSIDAYEESGGVLGALGRRAEELYQGLTPAARSAARHLLLRLVSVEEDTADIRRRAKRTELRQLDLDAKALDEVLQAFGSFRLLTFDQDPGSRTPTVEVAHEALLREWDRLKEWIEGEHDGLAQRRRLIAAIHEWRVADGDAAYLLAGGRLEHFEDWAHTTELSLTEAERGFLEQSRQSEDGRNDRRRRLRAGVIAALSAAAAIAVVFAFIARERQKDAESREIAAAAISVLGEDPELSVLLALEAASIADPPPEVVNALHEAVQTIRLTDSHVLVPPGTETPIFTEGYGSFSPVPGGTGRVVATPDGSNFVEWRIDGAGALEIVDEWQADGGPLRRAAVSSSQDGSMVAATGFDGRTFVWVNAEVVEFALPEGSPRTPTFTADGRLAVIGTASSETRAATYQLIEPSTGTVIDQIEIGRPQRVPIDVDLTPDGSALWVTQFNPSGVYRIPIDAAGFAEPEEMIELPTASYQTDVSLDGTMLAVAGDEGWVTLLELETGTLQRFITHDAAVRSIRWSNDGAHVAAGGNDGVVKVVEASSGRTVQRLVGNSAPSRYLAFSSDDRRIVTMSEDQTIRLWDLTTAPGSELAAQDLGSSVRSVRSAGDVYAVLTLQSRRPGTLYLLDASDLSVRATIPEQWGSAAAISADGTRIASQLPGADDPRPFSTGDIMISNGAGEELRLLDGICESLDTAPVITDFAAFTELCESEYANPLGRPSRPLFSPDGTLVAVSGGAVSVSEVESGRLLAAGIGFPRPGVAPRSDHAVLGWTPDGTQLIISVRTGGPDELLIVDAATLEVVEAFERDGNTTAGGISPDGRRVVLATSPGVLEILDLEALSVSTFEVHPNGMTAVAFSDDGTTLATAGADGEIKLWATETMELLGAVPYLGGSIEGLLLRGEHIVVFNDRGAVATLTTDTDELISVAERVVTRSLSDGECEQYLRRATCDA